MRLGRACRTKRKPYRRREIGLAFVYAAPCFGTLEMVSSLNKKSFDRIVSAVQANIVRCTKLGTWNKENASSTALNPVAQLSYVQLHHDRQGNIIQTKKGRGRGNWRRGKFKLLRMKSFFNNGGQNRKCNYCKKPEHFMKSRILRIANESDDCTCKPAHQRNHQQTS